MVSLFSYIAISLSLLLLTKLLLSFTTTKNKPPSPPSLPIIGHLHLIVEPLHRSLACLSARYGPILSLRFGSRPVLVVSSPSLAQECFTTNDIAFANRVHLPSSKHRTFNYTTIGSSNYGPHWRNIRRISTVEILSSHRLSSFITVRTDEVHSMVRRLFRESTKQNGKFTKVELKSRLFEFSLNNMMRMIAGKRYYEDDRNSEEEVRRFQSVVEGMFRTAGPSNIIGNFLPVLRWVGWRGMKREEEFVKYWDELLQGLIDEIRRDGKVNGCKSMIGVLLSLQETDPEYYTDQNIKAIVSSLLAAGTDTSAATIEWTMSLLLNNPDKLSKAQEEISRQIQNHHLLQESDLSSLPYLQSVITESLRLYPAGPLLVPHESAQECTVGGFKVPPGTMLLVNAYSIHRDPSTWSEPEKFMPERFENSEQGEELHYKLLPFGMGRRSCPGEGLARRVVGLVLGALIQCFEWERVGEELVDMSEGSGLTLPKAVPLEAIYRPRAAMEGVLSGL